MRRAAILPLLLLALPATAETRIRASYAAYATGLNIMNVDAGIRLEPGAYDVRVALRTAGMLSVFLRGEQLSTVQGRILDGGRLQPTRFLMDGTWRGNPRRLALDYDGTTPVVRAVIPPNGAEREEVPESMRPGTVDTLTALAILAEQVDRTGRCDGTLATFDGRRRVDFTARTVGQEVLVATRTAPFAGPALRCTFEGVQTAGFWRDQDRTEAARPQRGTAWFARAVPGAGPIPVRVEAETRWLGTTFLYLQEASVGDLPASQRTAGN